MFINILTGLHPLEAEVLVLVKDGKLEDIYKITRDVVEQAFPDIVWGDVNGGSNRYKENRREKT